MRSKPFADGVLLLLFRADRVLYRNECETSTKGPPFDFRMRRHNNGSRSNSKAVVVAWLIILIEKLHKTTAAVSAPNCQYYHENVVGYYYYCYDNCTHVTIFGGVFNGGGRNIIIAKNGNLFPVAIDRCYIAISVVMLPCTRPLTTL